MSDLKIGGARGLDATAAAVIAGAIKQKEAKSAKAELAEDSSVEVDFTARFRGILTKGTAEPDSERTYQPHVDLFQAGLVADLLRRLGVTPGQLKRSASAVARRVDQARDLEKQQENAALLSVIGEVSEKASEQLEAVTTTKPGRAASVRSDVEVEVVLDRLAGERAKAA